MFLKNMGGVGEIAVQSKGQKFCFKCFGEKTRSLKFNSKG